MIEICGALRPDDPNPSRRPILDDRICDVRVPCADHGTLPGGGIVIEGPGE